MSDRKPDETRTIGLKDIGEIGVPKADKEPWAEVAQRLTIADAAQSRTETQEDS